MRLGRWHVDIGIQAGAACKRLLRQLSDLGVFLWISRHPFHAVFCQIGVRGCCRGCRSHYGGYLERVRKSNHCRCANRWIGVIQSLDQILVYFFWKALYSTQIMHQVRPRPGGQVIPPREGKHGLQSFSDRSGQRLKEARESSSLTCVLWSFRLRESALSRLTSTGSLFVPGFPITQSIKAAKSTSLAGFGFVSIIRDEISSTGRTAGPLRRAAWRSSIEIRLRMRAHGCQDRCAYASVRLGAIFLLPSLGQC